MCFVASKCIAASRLKMRREGACRPQSLAGYGPVAHGMALAFRGSIGSTTVRFHSKVSAAARDGLFGQRRPLNSVIGWVHGTPFCFLEKQWQTKQPGLISSAG